MKSKMRESDIIFRFRHCLAFITTLVFLLIYGFNCYADSYTGTVVSDDYNTYYSMGGSYYSFEQQSIFSSASSDGFDTTKVVGYTASAITAQYLAPYLDGSVNYSFTIVGSVSDNVNSFDFSSVPYHVGCRASSSDDNTRCYAFLGDGNFGFIPVGGNTYYIISDSSFVVGVNFRHPNGGGYYYESVSNVSGNGLYCYLIDYMQLGFLDFPYYLPTSDGSSGFTSFNVNSTDFSFSSNNYDFNYVVKDGHIVNPNISVNDPDEVQPFSSDGLNFVFGSVDPEFTSTTDDMGIFAEYYFHLNSYMLTHPNEFTFHMEYKILATTVIGDGSFSYQKQITVADILQNNDQKFSNMLQWYDFEDSNDYNLGQLLNRIYTNAGNQSSSYTNGAVISYGVGRAGSTRTFGKMTSGVRNLYDNDISSMKFYYTCYFVWHGDPETTSGMLKGWKDLKSANNSTTQNDISNNYYPPSSDLASQYPSNSGGSVGNTTNNGGVFNDGDVIIYDNDGLWTPYTLDQVSYANVKDMFDDIREFIDSTSENSFWGVISGTFSYIPVKIWQYITITVAVICGFAVVRYVLRR